MGLSTFSKWLFYDLADPRIRDYAFFGNPVPLLLVVGLSILLCLKIIPHFMQNRRPMKFRFIWMYKVSSILISMYIVVRGWKIWMNFNLRCEPMDYSRSEEAMTVLNFK